MDTLALAIGGVGLLGLVSLSLMYAVGGAFGALNDVCNAAMGLLTAALAWRLYPWQRAQAPRSSTVALASAWAGALIAAAGSILVIFRVTGWYLAGLVTAFGYAFQGVWLLGASQAAQRGQAWPRPMVQTARVTGALMALGFLAGRGVLSRVDDAAAAPWWVNLSLVSYLGSLLLYPIWCLWFGRRRAMGSAVTGAARVTHV